MQEAHEAYSTLQRTATEQAAGASAALSRHADANTTLLGTLDSTLATVAKLREESTASVTEWTQSAVELLGATHESSTAHLKAASDGGKDAHAEAAEALKRDLAQRMQQARAALDAVEQRQATLEV